MTTDRFERRLPEILDEISLPHVPDYTDDILDQTARIRQRPGWTLPERWLPMDLTASPARIGRVPWRTVGVVALLILALAVAIVVVGSRTRQVNPFYGPAANGSIIYDLEGDIYVTDALGAPGRLLIGRRRGLRPAFLAGRQHDLVRPGRAGWLRDHAGRGGRVGHPTGVDDAPPRWGIRHGVAERDGTRGDPDRDEPTGARAAQPDERRRSSDAGPRRDRADAVRRVAPADR